MPADAYVVTFTDLDALATAISFLDEAADASGRLPASSAHGIIERILGADAWRVYCQEDAVATLDCVYECSHAPDAVAAIQ